MFPALDQVRDRSCGPTARLFIRVAYELLNKPVSGGNTLLPLLVVSQDVV